MKVLLIDDDPECLQEMQNIITSTKTSQGESYEVVVFREYKAALNAAYNGEQFDIVITDIVMGERRNEGIEVLKYFANRLPVGIAITAYPTIPNCVEAMRAGAWDYIEKNPTDGADPYARLLESLQKACEYRLKNPHRAVANPDSEWVHEHLSELLEKYPGKLVAVLYERVVDFDTNFSKLSSRIESKFPLAKPTIVSIPDGQKEKV